MSKFLNFIKILFLILIPLVVGGGLVYGIAREKPSFLGLPTGAAKGVEDVDALVKEVGKLIALPQDEKPTVATVTDVAKVKDQQFFKNALNGDKVLIYTNNKKAILYRPSEKKIVEVGSVNINQQPKAVPTPEATIGPSVEVSPTPVATVNSSPVPVQ